MSIFTPTNQRLLTNVAIVRLKRGKGSRFEIACYPNKVEPWREGVETDIDEVIQARAVFTNVSKGAQASKDMIKKSFRTDNVDEVIRIILDKGELQLTQAEREKSAANLFRDIASLVSQMCVNSETMRPFTRTTIETAMRDELHYSVTNQSAKQQALHVVKSLASLLPLTRAQMRLRVTIHRNAACDAASVARSLLEATAIDTVEKQTVQSFTCLADPGQYRAIEEMLRATTVGAAAAAAAAADADNDDYVAIGDDASSDSFSDDNFGRKKKGKGKGKGKKGGKGKRGGGGARKGRQQAPGSHGGGDGDGGDAPLRYRIDILDRAVIKRGEATIADEMNNNADNNKNNNADHLPALNTLRIAQPTTTATPSSTTTTTTTTTTIQSKSSTKSKQFKCKTCEVSFDDLFDHREHYKSDVHRFNLKRKCDQLPIVSEAEFVAEYKDALKAKEDEMWA